MSTTPPEQAHRGDVALEDDEAWADSPEHRASLQRAVEDSVAGRVYRLSEEDLVRLMEQAEQARSQGHGYELPRQWLRERDAAHRQAQS